MLFRASKTLVAIPDKQKIICHDFLSKVSIECEAETLYWLSCFGTWKNPASVAEHHPEYDRDNLLQQFRELQHIGLLQKKGTAAARRQQSYDKEWKFGLSSAMLHFTCLDSEFMSLEQSMKSQLQRLKKTPSPELFYRDCPIEGSIGVDQKSEISDLLTLMASRRTNRTSEDKSIGHNELLNCLFAGLGITAFTKTGSGMLPLKMTPSGGARNPYEAYILVKNVEGIHPGFYHFSACDCRLTPLDGSLGGITSSELLAGQDWAEDMPAIIFLVAVFERTMWKYQDSNAYRVVLIEAGHVAQNMILAATAHGLAGCPTAALAHSKISDKLNLPSVMHHPVYAITLSHPMEYSDSYIPNSNLPKALKNFIQDSRLPKDFLAPHAQHS
jgi:SagB-type dehydrogenase family enzyme